MVRTLAKHRKTASATIRHLTDDQLQRRSISTCRKCKGTASVLSAEKQVLHGKSSNGVSLRRATTHFTACKVDKPTEQTTLQGQQIVFTNF